MCPIGIVLTDSPYGPATDTLAGKRLQKYGKSRKGCPDGTKKNPQPKLDLNLRAQYLSYHTPRQ